MLSHLRREVEGNYRQGARDRTGLPVDVPRILRSRRVVGRGFLATTCLLSVPILLFTTILFILFPRIGLSLLLLSHPRAGRMIGFSEHVDLGDVGVLRDDPTVALRFEVKDLPEPPPTRLTLRLRGTAFDAYDGHAWARTQHDTVRPADHGYDASDTYPLFRSPDPRDRVVSFDLEPIDPPVVFLPPHAVALHLKLPTQMLLGDAVTLQRGPEDELRYSGSDGRGLRYDVYLAGEREGLVEPLSPADRRPLSDAAPESARSASRTSRTAGPTRWPRPKRRRWPSKSTSTATSRTISTRRRRARPSRSITSSSSRGGDTASSSRPRWPSCSAPWGSRRAT